MLHPGETRLACRVRSQESISTIGLSNTFAMCRWSLWKRPCVRLRLQGELADSYRKIMALLQDHYSTSACDRVALLEKMNEMTGIQCLALVIQAGLTNYCNYRLHRRQACLSFYREFSLQSSSTIPAYRSGLELITDGLRRDTMCCRVCGDITSKWITPP